MGWTVTLEKEDKSTLSVLTSEFEPLNDELKKTKLLCYLDHYGDTTYNRLQMDDLIKDLFSLEKTDSNPLIREVIKLAERCKSETHLYLTFYGD